MPAESTWTPIATASGGSAGTNVFTFSSIPQTYTDLCVMFYGRSNFSANTVSVYGWVNGQTGTSLWGGTQLIGDGSSVTSGRYQNSSIYFIGQMPGATQTANFYANGYMYIPNYANSTHFKTIMSRMSNNQGVNSTDGKLFFYHSLFRATDPITSIGLGTDGNTSFATNSMATLYGIRAA